MNFHHPMIMNNKNLRQDNPRIRAHFEECKKELDRYPRINGVIQDEKIVDWVKCPVCDFEETHQWIVKWGGRYDECPRCTHIFSKNRLKKSILSELYKESQADVYDREVQKNDFNRRYWGAVYDKYLSYLWNEYRKEASILDVGAGSGQFIRYCHKKGALNLHALDVYDGFQNQLNDIIPLENLYVVDSFETSTLKNKFDLIFLWGVFEHLCDPHKVLSKCSEYLNPGGKIFILIPNIHSRAKHILGATTPTINPREHINFFTEESMRIVANKSGLKIIELFQELPIIDLMWPYIEDSQTIISEIYTNKECYLHIYFLERTSNI